MTNQVTSDTNPRNYLLNIGRNTSVPFGPLVKGKKLLLVLVQKETSWIDERYTCTVIATARDSGKPPTIHEEPLNLVAPINGPECLKGKEADDDTIEEGM